jgi:hypothetical protein
MSSRDGLMDLGNWTISCTRFTNDAAGNLPDNSRRTIIIISELDSKPIKRDNWNYFPTTT